MNDIGLYGLGVMGQSLVLNMANKGFSVSVFNIVPDDTEKFMKSRVKGEDIFAFYDLKSFVDSLSRPRKVYLLIRSGKPVDDVIGQLLPYLDKGDLIIDGGNSHFNDTDRRMQELKEKGILFLGIGISGGEAGALYGPSLMPGGTREAYELVKNILLKIAAQTEAGPCCAYMGDSSAGHFVKMVHNGIEYGLMQAISEAYDILRKALNLSSEEIGRIFENWNSGSLNSFLMEISYKLMKHKDKATGKPTVELILDKAGQKGTGKWTAETALDLGIPAPSLTAAVEGRTISFFKEFRVELSGKIQKKHHQASFDREKMIRDLEKSLLFSCFTLFSQGLWIIAEASKEYKYGVDLSEVLRVWKDGSVIRVKMLDFFREIISENKENVNLLDNEKSLSFMMDKFESIKYIASVARDLYIPTLVFNTSMDYFLSLAEENSPANLIQAQRDFFGAHTYNRADQEGIFHTNWEEIKNI